MLNANRVLGHHLIEGVTVEVTGDRLVIPDGPDPRAGWAGGGRIGQCRGQAGPIPDVGRANRHRPAGGDHGQQVEVMVVQTG
jgi:hypothetical protein